MWWMNELWDLIEVSEGQQDGQIEPHLSPINAIKVIIFSVCTVQQS